MTRLFNLDLDQFESEIFESTGHGSQSELAEKVRSTLNLHLQILKLSIQDLSISTYTISATDFFRSSDFDELWCVIRSALKILSIDDWKRMPANMVRREVEKKHNLPHGFLSRENHHGLDNGKIRRIKAAAKDCHSNQASANAFISAIRDLNPRFSFYNCLQRLSYQDQPKDDFDFLKKDISKEVEDSEFSYLNRWSHDDALIQSAIFAKRLTEALKPEEQMELFPFPCAINITKPAQGEASSH